ncbi:SDR family NAD(P)-dependent oxidoreductase [Phenylobacterium deserti]|uniref:Short-chain dehydrogenase n=1 Tax=Phenylobacterium deserti TaxID=1914756 RepID=A0A328AER2_9CAUL|nr:SDR family NAD(P)-dependent oxidoreductase [Phenylobacterium deserti]RAK52696.1 short-chain dehydrogenase [Phenylobacterium deserti]
MTTDHAEHRFDSRPHDPASRLSRRGLLALSAVGLTAATLGGCASTGSADGGWTAADVPSQRGRTALVTGGNGHPEGGLSGLGYHVALQLARAGADVTIASRKQARGAEAVRIIRAEVPGATIRYEPLDLADLSSVSAFCGRMHEGGRGLDLLVNNAGVMGRRHREVSVDGFERCMATNVIGHFALTAQLLPLLKQGRSPRVVWVASLRGANGELDFSDLQLARAYDYVNSYDQTKLAMLLLAQEFQRRSQDAGLGVTSIAAHPGTARTHIVLDGPGPDSQEGFRFKNMPFMFRDPAGRALSLLYAATDSKAVGGRYYGPAGFGHILGPPGETPIPERAQDAHAASKLWAAMETLSHQRLA